MSCFVRVRKVKSLSLVQLFVTPWTVAYKAPPSMGFPRQEYWSGLPSPSAGDLPDPGIERGSPAVQADALTSEPPGKSSFYQNEGKYPCLRVDPQLQEKTLLVRLFEVTSRPWTPTSLAPVGWSVCVCVFSHSVVSESATPWTVAHQAPLSLGFFRQEYCSGLLFLPPGNLPYSGL